jgi:hypothetical protein
LIAEANGMLKLIDRAFAVLLLFGAAGHLMGSLTLLPPGSDVQVWSLGSTLCAALVAGLNFLRAGRPGDLPVIWLALIGATGWFVIVLLFAHTLGTFADFRVIWHGVAALALAVFSMTTLLHKRG